MTAPMAGISVKESCKAKRVLQRQKSPAKPKEPCKERRDTQKKRLTDIGIHDGSSSYLHVEGINFGVSGTIQGRTGRTACENTVWLSESTLRCSVAAGADFEQVCTKTALYDTQKRPSGTFATGPDLGLWAAGKRHVVRPPPWTAALRALRVLRSHC